MIDEYKKLGCKKDTFKVEIELPIEFKRDFTEVGMFENKNLMAECFDRILSAIRCKDVSCIATYEREICEVMKIVMGNAKIESEDLKTDIDERIKEAVEDLKRDFIEKTRDKIIKLQTYKMFPYEETVYVERDEVLRIFNEHSLTAPKGNRGCCIEIAGNATNGDVVRTMFPNAWKSNYIDSDNKCTLYIGDDELEIDIDWWNAPYNAESED